MKAYWWSVSIAPRILNLGNRRKWVVSLTPPLFTPVPIVYKGSRPQSRSEHIDVEEKKNPCPAGEERASDSTKRMEDKNYRKQNYILQKA